MKKLSDYKDEEAIVLWCDLADPITEIIKDPEVINILRAGKPPIIAAKEILNKHSDQVQRIILRVDPTPINGLNLLTRVASIISEIGNDPLIKDFFALSAEKTVEKSSGSVMANTEVKEN